MCIIMHDKYEKNFIENRYDLKYSVPTKVFKEKRNAEDYILREIPFIMKNSDPDFWKGPDTNENRVEMILGKNMLEKHYFKVLSVAEGD